MRTHYLRIKENFIAMVRSGEKKREYRLATPERQEIKVGDNLVLISNQNRQNFVRTTVKKIIRYDTWAEALGEHWKDDFKDMFSSLDEALKVCYKFYPKNMVDMYGIIVFEVAPVHVSYAHINVLLDTNVLIRRESNNNVSFEVTALFNWFDKKAVMRYIHSSSRDEISTYKDEVAKRAILTKLDSYEELPKFPVFKDDKFEEVCSLYSRDKNGEIDNALLGEVYSDNVEILVTDDGLMLQKAEKLYIRDKVLTVSELLNKFEELFPKNITYKMLNVKLKKFSDVNLQDEFFDTLREDYEGQKFDNWFKSKGNNEAYVFESKGGALKGFLALKTELENEPDYLKITPILTPKKRLKVSTFKTDSAGFKLGERFLKIIFDNAVARNVDEIYVTMFNHRTEVKRLEKLMEDWGFRFHGTKNSNGELVLVKSMKQYDEQETPKFNFPVISESASKYFLPIKAVYHTDLFPDKILKNEDMRLYEDNITHRYAIEKIYLSGVRNIFAKPGDIVLIYRMSDAFRKHYSSVVTGLAIVQEIVIARSAEDCVSVCKDRSIFKDEDIRENYKTRPTVVKLLDYVTFRRTVNLSKLRGLKIIGPDVGPRQFVPITQEQFETIYKLGMEE